MFRSFILCLLFCSNIDIAFGDDTAIRKEKVFDFFINDKCENTCNILAILYGSREKTKIDSANKKIQEIISKAKRQENGLIDWDEKKGEGLRLYWSLPSYSRLICDKRISSNLNPHTRHIIEELLFDFCGKFENLSMSDIGENEILRVYGSENHDIIRKSVFLLTAQALKNDPDRRDILYPDGQSAAKHYNEWLKYFLEYFRVRAGKGLVSEIDSTHYVDAYLTPIFNIFDCAEDSCLKLQAEKFLDLYFADIAQENLNGIRGGAKTRVYKEESYLADYDRTVYYTYVLAGRPTKMPTLFADSALSAAISSYKLPNVIIDLFTNTERKGVYAYISRRLAEGINFDPVNGRDYYQFVNSSAIYRYSYCTPHYILGFSTIDESKNYTLLYAQNQWMGLITDASENSRIVINGLPNITKINEQEQRWPVGYYQIQGFGNKQAAIFRRQTTDYQRNDKQTLITIFISCDFNINFKEDWCYGCNGNNTMYYAFKGVCFDKNAVYRTRECSRFNGLWVQYLDPNVMVILETAMKEKYKNLDSFINDVLGNELVWASPNQLRYHACGDAGELNMYNTKALASLNGKPVDLYFNKAMYSPFIDCAFDTNSIRITDTSKNSIFLDFNYKNRSSQN